MAAPIIQQLIELAQRLRAEAADFLENPGDDQLWYNRGYGSGILAALRELGHAHALDQSCADDSEQELAGHRVMAWGQAYQHGRDKGWSDTREALAQRLPAAPGRS